MTISTWRTLALLLLLAAPAVAQSKDNPLPPLPAGHSPVSMGYYFVDGKNGDHWNEVSCYTDAYYATQASYDSDDEEWPEHLENSLVRARDEGFKITLALDLKKDCASDAPCEPDLERIAQLIDIATPYWDSVERIELADEPDWTKPQINSRVDAVAQAIGETKLSLKPVGLTQSMVWIAAHPGQRLSDSALDWVGVEAYVDGPGSPDPEINRASVLEGLSLAETITGTKDLVIVFQAYNRNGAWTNLQTLVALQSATYEFVAYDTADRIKGIKLFAYGFGNGGTSALPELKVPHLWIAERLFGGTTCPPPPPPPPTVAAPSNLTAVGVGFTVELAWRDNSSNEMSFKVQRQDSTGAWPTIKSLPAGSITYSDSVPSFSSGSVTYSFRVVAANGTVLSNPSNTTTVTLYALKPAGVPETIGPNGCINTVRPTFSWNPVARATHYYLSVTQDAVESFFIDNPEFSGTSYTAPFDLDFGVPHRWKVKACNNQGCADNSPSVYFTPFCAPTQAPILFEPKGCIESAQPTLTWSTITGATGYQVALFQVTDITNDPLIEYTEVTGTSFVPSAPLLARKEYRFRVKAKVGPTSGPFSHHRFFTVQCHAATRPGTAGPIAPWDAPIPAPGPVAFAWEVAANAETYRLKVTNDHGHTVFDQTLAAGEVCGTDECGFTPNLSFQSGAYTWLLRTGSSTRGNGIWGPGVTFTVP